MDQLKYESHRSTTKLSYYNTWKNFNKFLIRLDKMPRSWEERLCLYCTFLITIKKRKSSTVRSYISGIKHILVTDGYEWNDGLVILNTLTKSCKLKNDTLKVRLPIQKGLLELILFRIQRKFDNQPYLETMYITAFLLQYYGLFRVGEIAYSPHSIKAINVHEANSISNPRILIVLYSSKTHNIHEPPQKIKIFGNKTIEISDKNSTGRYTIQKRDLGKFCPVQWTKKFIEMRGPISNDDENLFTLRDRGKTPITGAQLRKLLREILTSFGLQADLYDTHSFRIGRATDLFKSGVHIEDIKQLGRWKSNAVYKYLKNF